MVPTKLCYLTTCFDVEWVRLQVVELGPHPEKSEDVAMWSIGSWNSWLPGWRCSAEVRAVCEISYTRAMTGDLLGSVLTKSVTHLADSGDVDGGNGRDPAERPLLACSLLCL